ncbi:MAG: PKD domain-containing protein [Bacteroidales bacterium]|nr:PKD domain-containing protein [Bacteroidales bacterium]
MRIKLYYYLIILFWLSIFSLSSNSIYAQCNSGTSTTNAGALTLHEYYQTINVNSGTRYTFAGVDYMTYIFTFCEGGGSYSGDTQLEICDASGATVYAYNDDFCGLGSSITFTPPANGVYSVVIYRYNCNTTSSSIGTMAYRVLTPPSEADCLGALPLCDVSNTHTISASGEGNYTDLYDFNTNDGMAVNVNNCPNCLVSGEDNNMWYTFTVASSGSLAFLINPVNSADDYDWALWRLSSSVTCEDLINYSANPPLSCNYCGTTGPTGLGSGSTSCEGPNSCSNYNSPLTVTAGDTYVINVSNFSASTNGYNINFSGSTASIVDNDPAYIDHLIYAPYCGSSYLTVQFSEKIWCTGVNASDFTLTGPNGTYTINDVWSDFCQAGLGSTYGDTYYDDIWNFALGDYLQHDGTYTLTAVGGGVTDICGNYSPQSSITFTIDGITATGAYTDPSCYNVNDGTITISGVSGGTSPYNFNWVGPSGFTSTQQNLTGLAPGSYTITIGDSNGLCEWTETLVLNAPPPVAANVSTTNPGCAGNNGSITITPTSGVPPFTVQANSMTQSGVTVSHTFTNLSPGTYNLTLTDADGCENTNSVTLVAPDIPDATFTYNGNQCFTGQSFNFTHTGTPVPSESYSWNFGGGTPASSTAHNPTGITFNSPGTHTVTLTISAGASGCTDTESVDITVYPDPVPSITTTNENCGICDGTATVTTSYSSYSWSSGGSGITENNLCSGTYTVTVQDSNGCIGSNTFTINSSGSIPNANVVTTPPVCPGDCNATATVNATGAPSYAYTYSDGTTPNNQSTGGLCAGNYTVTVADATNPACYTIENFSISDPAGMSLTMSSTDATCGLANGSASVSVSGGSNPYSYNWSNGGITGTINNILAGNYTVTVTDGDGCTVEGSVSVIDGGVPFSISTSVVSDASCNNYCDGSATVTVTGGSGPFSYTWSSGSNPNSQTVTGLCDGTHYVTVAEGLCQVNASVSISEPPAITATTSTVGSHCGLPDGSATVTASGGTVSGDYSYEWSSTPAQYSATATNLVAGVYSVTVEDDNGCTESFNANVPDLGGVSVNITTLPASCNGSTDGSATAHVSGGTADFTYLWSTGSSTTTPDLTNTITVGAGPVSVIVTDASGCTAQANATISQPPALVLAVDNTTPTTCNGDCDGTVTISYTGGTPPVSYSWGSGNNPNAATNTNLCAGTHSVTVTDNNACSASISYSITQPAPIVLSTTVIDANCGNSDGSASVTASGGTVAGDYLYQWSAGTPSTNSTVTGLSAAGSPYTVIVTDDNGCSQTASVTVNDIAGPSASISSYNDVTCAGLSDGQATVSVGGGTPNYTYIWNTTPPQTAVTAMGLGMGYYEVTVTDQIGCTTTAGITINEPGLLTLNILPNAIDCFGNCSGEAFAQVTGGTTPYSPIWSNLNTTLLNSGLCAGDYSVTITDAHGCTISDDVTILENEPIIITGDITESDCGQANGSIDVDVTGGSTPYSYLWNTGDLTQDLLNISAGTYIVTVTDNKGCQAILNFAVNDITGPVATIGASSNVSCFGVCDGTITVNVVGGSGIFQYNWSTTPAQTSATATNLCAGNYSVTVNDLITGCIATTSATITEPLALASLSTVENTSCYNDCDGSIELTPYNGTPPYSFNWTGPGTIPNDEDIYNLCHGDYTVAIIDDNGCILTNDYTVDEPDFITIPTSSTLTSCNGLCNGTATASPYGGTPPYTYLWSDNAQTTQTAVGLCEGTYTVTVYDNNGCSETNVVTVNSPTQLSFANVSVDDVLCYGGSSGNIQVIPTGGTPPYDFLWSNGSTNSSPINLPAGQHCVTVSDNNGCEIDTCIYINEPPVINVQINATNETCYNSCDGEIEAIVTGGSAPFTYLWSNNETNSIINNLCSGIYNLTVIDINGCNVYTSGSITGPNILDIVTQNTIQPHCSNSDGMVAVSVVGGVPPYSYIWSDPGGSSNTLNNIPAGTYTVTVTDSHGCSDFHSVSISDISAPEITDIIISNVQCSGNSDGTAEVIFTSTTPSNTIAWSNGQNGPIAINLAEGTYSVTITDENNCSASESFTITQPNPVSIEVANINHVTCNGFCNASAIVQTYGGTLPLTITWNGGQTGHNATGLCAGLYVVTVTDANGCIDSVEFEITEPDPIEVDAIITPATCYGSCDGVITLTVSGGHNNYSVDWPQLGQNTMVVEGLCAGPHTVIVYDASDAGCFVQETFVVTQPPPIQASFDTDNATCDMDNGSAWVSSIYGGSGGYTYLWNPGGYTSDSIYNAAPGLYEVLITDINGCNESYQVSIGVTQPPQLDNVNYGDVTCFGGNDGYAEIYVSQGMPPYEYNWSPDVTDEWASYELTTNIYAVTIVDADGCEVYTTFPIGSPSEIELFTDGDRTICIGDSTIVSASASGGIPPYTFLWEDLGYGPSYFVDPIVSTDYNVIAIDANGCESATGQVHITVNPPLDLTVNIPPSICEGDNAQLVAVAEGGDGNYLYHWSDDNSVTVENTHLVSPTENTTYQIVLSDGCGTPNDTVEVTVNVAPGPEINLTKTPYKGCSPLLVTFDNETTNLTYTYDWNFADAESGENNWSNLKRPTHLFEEPGNYLVSVDITTAAGCTERGTTTVRVHTSPIADFIAHPWSTGLFDSQIDFTDQSIDAYAWEWHFGDGHQTGEQNPTHVYYDQGEFPVMLIAFSQEGCIDTVVHNVEIIEDHRLYMPTAINIRTPGNDELYPKGVGFDYDSYKFEVYNRWGELIFTTNDINEHWKGRYSQNKGDYVPQGMYVWIITLKDKYGKDHTYSGQVTVFK